MWRTGRILLAGWLWSAVVLIPGILAGVLTLGLLSHRLIDLWAPLWGRGLLRIAGIRLRVIGLEHIAGRRNRLVVMNHTSTLDMIAIAALGPPGLMALGKKEFMYVPIIGQAWWALGQAFIDRNNRARARASLERLAERMRRHPRSVVIFPEGTRSRNGELQRFKMGAFHFAQQTGVEVVPAVLYGAFALNRPDSWHFERGELVMVLHPPESPECWKGRPLKEVCHELHDRYAEWLKEPVPAGGTRLA